MLKVGITGQSGFIGTHLYNNLGLFPSKYQRIPFEDQYFENPARLEEFVRSCDVIVHLAAMNRHHDPDVIYRTNLQLVRQLITAMEVTGSSPHVLFSSSTQEERDNLYGKSKYEGREMLTQWAARAGARFTGMIIPNVFGPFGNPYYNSVVATFCHQLAHGETPVIEVDGELKLIYVGELVALMLEKIDQQDHQGIETLQIGHTATCKVSTLLSLLQRYNGMYADRGIIPGFASVFERNLFNTFRCYMDIKNHFPVKLVKNTDDRGSFVETVKLETGGQVSFSTTVPGITRGNHFHTRKIERFAVIRGKARIQLRRIGTSEILSFDLSGDQPAYVDMPIWYTHNITNTGDEELYTIFWINEFFDPADPDTYFEKIQE